MNSELHTHLAKTIAQGKTLWRPPNGRYEIEATLNVPGSINAVDMRGVEIVVPPRPSFHALVISDNSAGCVRGGRITERDGRDQSGGGAAGLVLESCSGTRVDAPEVIGCGRGVILNMCKGARLASVSVTASWSYAVEIRASHGTVIDQCRMRLAWRDAIKLTGGSSGLLVQDTLGLNCGRGQAIDPTVNGDGIDTLLGGSHITLLRFTAIGCTHDQHQVQRRCRSDDRPGHRLRVRRQPQARPVRQLRKQSARQAHRRCAGDGRAV